MKLLKVYISAFCMCSLSVLLNSCDDFLKEEPLDMKSSDQFWKTKADAESGVNALYFGGVPYLHNTDVGGGWTPKATMWGGIVSGLYVDKRKDRTFTTASEGCNFNIESFDDIAMKYWHEFYKGISRANFVIANIPTMTGVLDEATINNYVAQGKFFRAYGYFWLVKEFGGVPYISEPYTSTEGMYKERLSAEEVYKKIEADLLDIVNGDALPNKTFYENGCYVTRAMAQTLLAQVYLQWAGAPLNGGADYYGKAAQMALNVINDNNASEALELRGKRYLEKAAMITASVDVPLKQISRYDLNIASGIIHTAKEHGVTDVIIGLHRKVNIVDSFFGMLAENLLKGLHREVMIAKFLMPINTIRRINIAVPPKAEYEAGFQKWVEHFCRMGSTLGCRVHFFANEETTTLLQILVKKRFSSTMTDFSRLDDWGDLLLLTGQVNYDHLLVIISARRGSISYDPAFERLPAQLGKYFANNSLIVLYPDQLGEPQDMLSFSNPRGNNEDQHYEKVGKWFYKWFKKSN